MINFGVTSTGDITRKYMDNILIEERLIDSVEASTQTVLFGRSYTSPIATPAFSHMKSFGEGRPSALVEYAQVCKDLGLLNFIGMIENENLKEILATGADTVRIVKPYADREKVLDQIRFAEENGCVAVGMDIDHIFNHNGSYDVVVGETMAPVTFEDLNSFVQATKLPFIVKGVLSVSDALKAAKAGAKGIVVSHHSGIMPCAVPPLMILPKIKEALKDYDMTIFVDCHIDSGVDAFKALALGADAVGVGRAMMPALTKEGVPGLAKFMTKMSQELKFMMDFTGFEKISEIDSSVLYNL